MPIILTFVLTGSCLRNPGVERIWCVLFLPAYRPRREQRDVNDHVALNIPQHRDVKLNELPKQIFMLLPLLLHWLYFFNSERGGGGGMPPYAEGC